MNQIILLSLSEYAILPGEESPTYITKCNGSQYIHFSGLNCVDSCNSFIFVMGQKLCGDGLDCGELYMVVDSTETKLTCGECNDYALQKFCIKQKCDDYFITTCQALPRTSGSCNRPLTDGKTCKTIDEGCSKLLFQKGYSCQKCDQPGDYVSGVRCVDDCADYIFSPLGLRICAIYGCNDVQTHNYSHLQQNGYTVSCKECSLRKLGKFCVSSCWEYHTSKQCEGKTTEGNCFLSLDYQNSCRPEQAGCLPLFMDVRTHICDNCHPPHTVDATGRYCQQSCIRTFYAPNGLWMCLDQFECAYSIAIVQKRTSIRLSCGSCAGVKLNDLCLTQQSCRQYQTNPVGCRGSITHSPDCEKPNQFQNQCYATCPKGWPNSLGICIDNLYQVYIVIGCAVGVAALFSIICWRRLVRCCCDKTNKIKQETAIDMMKKYVGRSRVDETEGLLGDVGLDQQILEKVDIEK